MSGTTSCDLSSLKAYLLHLPLLCVAIWWIDIDLLTGAQWPQVLGSFVLFAYCLAWHSFLFFWVMPFVFCETAVNTKSKVPLFQLINLFAHLLSNTWDSIFLWSRGPFIILPLPSVPGLSLPLTLPSNILWEPRAGCPLLKFPVGANLLQICALYYFPLCVKCQVCLLFQEIWHASTWQFLRVISIILPAVGMAETKYFL